MQGRPMGHDFVENHQPPFRKILYATVGALVLLVAPLILWPNLARYAFSSNYLPHLYCYLDKPSLVWTHAVADSLIGVSYVAISGTLAYLIYRGRTDIPFRWMFLAFGLFIIACGSTHFMEVVTVWIPVYVLSAAVKIFTAIASMVTAIILPLVVSQVVLMVRNAKAAQERKLLLEAAWADRDLAQEKLREINQELERGVQARTIELETVNRNLQTEINERKRIQQRLAELAAIVEFSDDAIVGKTLDGTVTSWNLGAERVYGYTAREALGRQVSFLVPDDRQDETSEILRRIAQGEKVEHFETVRVTKSGKRLHISLSVSPIRDQTGAIVGASAIGRNISAEKRAADALRESEIRYRILFDSNPASMWVFDAKTLAFLQVNEAAIRQYGYSRQEFLGMTIADIRPPEDVPALMKSAFGQGSGLEGPENWRHRKKDGTIFDVEITSHEVNLSETKGVLVLALDVTERKRHELRLRQSEERFSKAFRSSPVAITISTRDQGKYVDANDAFLKMVEYGWEELIGHTALELNIWACPAHRTTMTHSLDRSGHVRALETEFRTKSGKTRNVQVSAEPITLDDTSCVLAITVDVTDTKRLEEQFRQAQKMEAVGRLAGGIAHDFNNMLGVITGYSDLSLESLEPESRVRKNVDQIKKAANRAGELTRQLLAFSRQQILNPGVLNLNTVVHNVSKMLLRMIGEDIAIKFIPGAPLGNVRADLSQLEQVLMNLAVNARDAMPRGGTILIETANADLDEHYAKEHPSVVPGPYAMLSMSDTGSGMDSGTLSRIFEPFFTTKAPGHGTGLGLSMVYGIVKQSGGHIWVYSEPGKGTTFRLYFPRINEPADSIHSSTNDERIPGGSETILLVEDDAAMRELTACLLESEGYRVLKAEDAQAAITAAERHPATLDLLLTDVIMPGMSGPELAAYLQASRPTLKTLYMSGYTGRLVEHHGVLDFDNTLLQKPFTKQALLRRLRATIDS